MGHQERADGFAPAVNNALSPASKEKKSDADAPDQGAARGLSACVWFFCMVLLSSLVDRNIHFIDEGLAHDPSQFRRKIIGMSIYNKFLS